MPEADTPPKVGDRVREVADTRNRVLTVVEAKERYPVRAERSDGFTHVFDYHELAPADEAAAD